MLFRRKSDAEKAREQRLKTLERAVKAQQKEAAKAQKQQQKAVKQQQKALQKQQQAADKAHKQQLKQQRQAQKQAERAHKQLVKQAVQASRRRKKAAKRAERQRQKQQRRLPPFKKSNSCVVCAKRFKSAPHRRRHHCRQCRESCCLHCVSAQRRPVPHYKTPQKVCVVCAVLVLPEAAEPGPRDPAEALAGLASRPAPGRRPSSAPLRPTEGVAVPLPRARRGRSVKWALPLRRKRSAQRVRKMDLDLLLEKQALQAGRAIELQPQAA